MSAIKSLVGFLLAAGSGVLMIGAVAILPCLYLFGGAWLSISLLKYMAWPVLIALALCALLFLPLTLFRATRQVSAVGFAVSSYIFGVATWMAGIIATVVLLGWFWAIIGVFVFAVGVVPLGILGFIINSDWIDALLLGVGLVLTYGTRLLAGWMIESVS
jgi:hypothetical protein